MSVEYFEIVTDNANQAEDAGWYFQQNINGVDVGDPCGPFYSQEAAILEFKSLQVA